MVSELREYARNMAEAMATIGNERAGLVYRLLVEHGEDAVWSPLPDGEEYGFAKQCHGNATTRVLLGTPGLTYYEGIVGAAMVIPHAWAQDESGRVYELTLRHNDERCGFCHGEGKLHPTDHYDYYGSDDEDPDPDALVECEMCGGTGKGLAESREGMAYLGIPIPVEVLRASVIENDVYGVLFEDTERVAKLYATAGRE